ncbi:unnamed protein product [Triticum turgidum subsp. durum]|uniref:Uncharacterized protein n=1 Tax=Triticum turgidum subsp. durum TaxID=4567 RepID=A0A9R1Q102_TRITD|nr:unnamed protein product [Triticum turgidum subsp. durum]
MERFRRWMEQHGKSYPTVDEELRRFEVYRRNVERIEATNQQVGHGYTLGENQFTDLTSEEFLARYTGRFAPPEMSHDGDMLITTRAGDVAKGQYPAHRGNLSAVPESVDWRAKGAVTPVRHQGDASGAFAAVAAVEGLYQIKTGKLVPLSVQELVDCDSKSFHCSPSGTPAAAFTYIKMNGGIAAAADYPYTAQEGICNSQAEQVAVSVRGYRVLPYNEQSEQKLLEAVAQQPVAVAVNHLSFEFQSYKDGVFSGPCAFEVDRFNHQSVTIVRYGEDAATGKKYWIIKNSWGQSWGMGGYMLMERGIADPRGLCGINSYPAYPTM